MRYTREAEQVSARKIGRRTLDLVDAWPGLTIPPDASAAEGVSNRMMALVQCALAACEADSKPMDAALYGAATAIGVLLASQGPATQMALLSAMQNGLNRGQAGGLRALDPQGRA